MQNLEPPKYSNIDALHQRDVSLNIQQFEHLIDCVLENNYGIVDHFLSINAVQQLELRLNDLFENGSFHRAGIGKDNDFQKNTQIRGDYVHWLDATPGIFPENLFFDPIHRLIDYLNRTCYTGIRNTEFHYALYPTGTFYKRHLDQFKGDDSRRFSVICYLNTNWQEGDGGELVLYLNGGKTLKVQPTGGRLIFFKSDTVEHEVLPTLKPRKSITGWLRV